MTELDGVQLMEHGCPVTGAPSMAEGVPQAPSAKPTKRQQARQDREYKWRLFRDQHEKKLREIRAEMARTDDVERLVVLEQMEINCLYALDGAPRDPLQAPAEEA
jgi:hypothetical protein